jgi:dTDP-glucose pyrophosphorylase
VVQKAVILAAGSASRMQRGLEQYVSDEKELSAIKTGEKMAARFGKFPFLDYQILNLVQAGVKKINLVLKPEDRFFTSHYNKYGAGVFPEAQISFSFQERADGTAHALYAARKFAGLQQFLLLNGDNYYSAESILMLLQTPEACCGAVGFDIRGFNAWTRKRLKSYAVVQTKNGILSEIVEKAPEPDLYTTSDTLYSVKNRRIDVREKVLTSMNLWCFTPDIIEACRVVPRHAPRSNKNTGEYELPDAVALLLEEECEIRVYYACEDVLDLTRAEDIKIVGERIRENLGKKITVLEGRYARAGGISF